jgi:hypothetical protein
MAGREDQVAQFVRKFYNCGAWNIKLHKNHKIKENCRLERKNTLKSCRLQIYKAV